MIRVRESLKGLNFKNFEAIPDFDMKLSEFLDRLDEELKYFRGYEEKDGQRGIRYPAVGYACLYGEKIVAISYYIVPKKFSFRWFFDLLFRPSGLESGAVVKKEYQRRGIAKHLASLKEDIIRRMGYRESWYRTDSDNVAMLRWSENEDRYGLWKRTDKPVFFTVKLDEGEMDRKNHTK